MTSSGYFPENVHVEVLTYVDGLPTWTDIRDAIVSPIKVNTGFSDGGPLERLAPGGDMRFDLNNISGAFDPSTSFYKGQKIRLRVKWGSFTKVKFFGYIDLISLDVGTWGQRRAHVVAIDWLALAAKTPIRALAGMTNTTIDLAVAALLTQMQMQPEATDFEIGAVTMPSVFDEVTPNSTVYSELQNLIMGEWGYIYLRDGGMTLKVENSLSRTGDGSDYKTTSYYVNDGVGVDFLLEDGTNFLLEDNTNFLLEGEPTAGSFTSDMGEEYTDLKINHGDNLVNKISEQTVPVVIGGSTLVLYPFDIATGSKALLVPPNSISNPYVLQGQYKDPTAGGAQISGSSVVTPVLTTDWKFNSKADGTGTDLSANITIAFTAGVSGFKALIVNAGPAGYITKFNVRGIPIYRYAPVETVIQDQRSIWDYGDYSLEFTREYGADPSDVLPYIFRLLMRDRKPRTIVGNPKFQAFASQDNLAGFLALDIGDQIRLTSTKPATDALYYIQGVRFTILPGSEQITYDYITTETLTGAAEGITEAAVEQTASQQAINFGYLPSVSNHVQRTICARLYISGLADIGLCTALAWCADSIVNSSYFRIGHIISASVHYLIFKYGANWSGTDLEYGAYNLSTPLPRNQWIDIIITYDGSSVANEPKIYMDGVLLSTYTSTLPTGTLISETGDPLIVGNEFLGGIYSVYALIGKYENVAIYNRILTAAEITAIHNGGTRLPFASYPQNGLKFFFGGMDDAAYADKLDETLDASNTLYDLVNGFTGQPIAAPTLRAVA